MAVKEAGAHRPARRRVQAAHQPVRFPGARRRGLRILRDVGREVSLPVVTEVVDAADVDRRGRIRELPSDWRPQHAELPAPQGRRARRGSRCCSNVGCPPGSTSCSSRQSTLPPRATTRSSSASAGCVPSRRRCGTRSISPAFPYLKARTHLPVIVDPVARDGDARAGDPHDEGRGRVRRRRRHHRVHENPAVAKSDGKQSLYPEQFAPARARAPPSGRGRGPEAPVNAPGSRARPRQRARAPPRRCAGPARALPRRSRTAGAGPAPCSSRPPTLAGTAPTLSFVMSSAALSAMLPRQARDPRGAVGQRRGGARPRRSSGPQAWRPSTTGLPAARRWCSLRARPRPISQDAVSARLAARRPARHGVLRGRSSRRRPTRSSAPASSATTSSTPSRSCPPPRAIRSRTRTSRSSLPSR